MFLPSCKMTYRFNPTCCCVPAVADGCCWERWRCEGCGELLLLLLNCCCCCWQDEDGLLAVVSACHCKTTRGLAFQRCGSASFSWYYPNSNSAFHEDANPLMLTVLHKIEFSMFINFSCTEPLLHRVRIFLPWKRQACVSVFSWAPATRTIFTDSHTVTVYPSF